MRPSILTGSVFVHKPAPGLLVTRQTSPALGGDLGNALTAWHGPQIPVRDIAASPAPGMIHSHRTWLPFSIADPLWITMLNGSVPLTPSDNCPLPALLPCHQLYGSAASGMTWCLP